ARGVREPARATGREHELFLFELEHEQLEELPLAPQDVRDVAQRHGFHIGGNPREYEKKRGTTRGERSRPEAAQRARRSPERSSAGVSPAVARATKIEVRPVSPATPRGRAPRFYSTPRASNTHVRGATSRSRASPTSRPRSHGCCALVPTARALPA